MSKNSNIWHLLIINNFLHNNGNFHILSVDSRGVKHFIAISIKSPSPYNYSMTINSFQRKVFKKGQICLYTALILTLIDSLCECVVCVSTIAHRNWHITHLWNYLGHSGPVHICSRYTTPAKCSRNKFSVHERSDCEHCEMFSVPLRSDLISAHISVCAVWLIVYTLRNVWGHINMHSPCW